LNAAHKSAQGEDVCILFQSVVLVKKSLGVYQQDTNLFDNIENKKRPIEKKNQLNFVLFTFSPEGLLTTKTSDHAQTPWVSGVAPLLHLKNWESDSFFSYRSIHSEFY